MNSLWEELIHSKVRDSISNQMFAMEKYDLAYGIQKADGSEVPISLVTMKHITDYVDGSDKQRTIQYLMKIKLHSHTGIPIDKLLDLPRHELQEYVRGLILVNKTDAPIMKKLEDEANNNGTRKSRIPNRRRKM